MQERIIGGYRLLEHIGDGGSARCWRVADDQGRYYVLKQFCPRALAPYLHEATDGSMILTADTPALQRRFENAAILFRREAASTQAIQALHAQKSNNDYFYACTLTEIVSLPGRYGAFLLYDTTGGEDLAHLLERRQLHLDRENGVLTALSWTRRIAEALAQMHGHLAPDGTPAPWLHLDLKPSNIYCTLLELDGSEERRVFRLLDLGSVYPLGDSPSSKALRKGIVLTSTPDYAAPELLLPGARPTAAADLYSLGAILFRMLSGHAYDCHDLPPATPAVQAIPAAARHVLTEELLRPLLEGRPEERPDLETFLEKIDLLRNILLGRGVCREILFTESCRSLSALPEVPEAALLPQWKLEDRTFDHLAALLAGTDGNLFLAGNGMQGKTYSLYHAALALARDPDGPPPLYIPLGAFRDAADKDHFLRDYILAHYCGARDRQDPVDALEECLNTVPCLLLADGLNEASGDPNFSKLTTELRRFLGMKALRVVIAAQADLRLSVFPGCPLALAQPQALTDQRIDRYLADAGISAAALSPSLRQTLAFPMLLKMYARSAAAVTDPALLADRWFRFRPEPKTAAEIVVNYREHVLTKLYDPRDPEAFSRTALLVREFLPQLAFRLCGGANVFSLSQELLTIELNDFFRELQGPQGLPLMAAYDYPDVTFGQPDTAVLDSNVSFAKEVEKQLSQGQAMTAEQSLHILQDLELADSPEEARALMGEKFFVATPADTARHTIASGRRAKLCSAILTASGLLWQDRDGSWRFLHETLQDILCADHLHRFLERCNDPRKRRLTLGRQHLPKSICRHLGHLCGMDFLRRALCQQRGYFDPFNTQMLSETYAGESGIPLDDKNEAYQLLLLLNGIHMALPDDTPITSEEFAAFFEEDSDSLADRMNDLSASDPFDVVQSNMISYTAARLMVRRISLMDPGVATPCIFPQSIAEYFSMATGSHALTNANLVEALFLPQSGVRAHEDLSRLDLSAARLRSTPLLFTDLTDAYLPPEARDPFRLDLPPTPPPGMPRVFLQHNFSGRFAYISINHSLRCFDLWEEREITGFDFTSDLWEPEEDDDSYEPPKIQRFWLSPDQPLLTVLLRDSSLCVLDAFNGDVRFFVYPKDDAPEAEDVVFAFVTGKTLFVQFPHAILEYDIREDHPPKPGALREHSRFRDFDTFVRGTLRRPGFELVQIKPYGAFVEKDETGRLHRLEPHDQFHYAAAYSPDGRQITLVTARGIHVLDTATRQRINFLPAQLKSSQPRKEPSCTVPPAFRVQPIPPSTEPNSPGDT